MIVMVTETSFYKAFGNSNMPPLSDRPMAPGQIDGRGCNMN